MHWILILFINYIQYFHTLFAMHLWQESTKTALDLPLCFNPTYIKLQRGITRSTGSSPGLAQPQSLPTWLFGSAFDCSVCGRLIFRGRGGATLTAELSIRWPVKAVCLVYTRRRGTPVDKAKPAVSESLELLDPLLWTVGCRCLRIDHSGSWKGRGVCE